MIPMLVRLSPFPFRSAGGGTCPIVGFQASVIDREGPGPNNQEPRDQFTGLFLELSRDSSRSECAKVGNAKSQEKTNLKISSRPH